MILIVCIEILISKNKKENNLNKVKAMKVALRGLTKVRF